MNNSLSGLRPATRTESDVRELHRKYPGPCKGCGGTDYGLSSSGPDYCGPCAMGTPPEITRLRRRNDELFTEMVALNFALGKVTGQFPPFNEQQHKIADDRLAKRKAEWEARGNASPEEIQNGSLHI